MRRAAVACTIAALTFAVYLTNVRATETGDSVPARLLPFSLLREGNLDLDEFDWLRRGQAPYFLVQSASGHWISQYPVALSVLVTPLYVPAVWWLRSRNIADDDVRFRLATVVMERIAAALVTSLSVALVFLAACHLAPLPVSAGVALAYAFGTATWSISSQALWQHGGAELCLAGLNLCLLEPDTRKSAIGAGAFAALAVMIRSSMLVFAMLALIFVLRERRERRRQFVVFPVAGAGLLLAYNVAYTGQLHGAQGVAIVFPHLESFAGLLLSPNRGLLVYTPAVVLAAPGFLSQQWRARPWLAYLGLGVFAYLLLFSCWKFWWGGYCYGPRLMTDALPAFALAAAPVVNRMRSAWLGRVTLVVLVAWGLVVQFIGVYCDDGSWNQSPVSVDKNPDRVWDWRDVQIIVAAQQGWHGTDAAARLHQAISDPVPVYLRPLSPVQLSGDIVTKDPLPTRMRRRSTHHLRLQVTNHSEVWWPTFSAGGPLECLLVYSWWRDKKMIPGEGGFVSLPRNVAPGASVDITAAVHAPFAPGTYDLNVVLAQDLDGTRGTVGSARLRGRLHID